MTAFANAAPLAQVEGAPYATAKLLPAAEGDLFNQPVGQHPVPMLYGQEVSAIVELSAQGGISSQTSFVLLQTDWGDGTWVDLCWLTWTGTSGTANFVLSAGRSTGNSSFQQTRAVGSAPSPVNGSNALGMGGRFRIVGKSTVTASAGGSSTSSGTVVVGVLCTIKYRVQGLR